VLAVHLVRFLLEAVILTQKLFLVDVLYNLILGGEWLVTNLVGPLVVTPEVVLAVEGH
jgi:hypothetical protein